jgi:hypothetical protein
MHAALFLLLHLMALYQQHHAHLLKQEHSLLSMVVVIVQQLPGPLHGSVLQVHLQLLLHLPW